MPKNPSPRTNHPDQTPLKNPKPSDSNPDRPNHAKANVSKPRSFPILAASHFKDPEDPAKLIAIAKLGRAVGLKGAMKCHIYTDFLEIFNHKVKFFAKLDGALLAFRLLFFDEKKSHIAFEEITTPEQAKALTHYTLYTTIEDTKRYCALGDEEFFWFELIGYEIVEEGQILGHVSDIERIGSIDYLIIETAPELGKSYAKSFLIPYLEVFITQVHRSKAQIATKGAKALLEAS